MSTDSMATAAGEFAIRWPLNSTSVRAEPKPRRLIVAAPAAVPRNRLDSPIELWAAVMFFTRLTVLGEPCFCRSAAPITSTGWAASSGVPAM